MKIFPFQIQKSQGQLLQPAVDDFGNLRILGRTRTRKKETKLNRLALPSEELAIANAYATHRVGAIENYYANFAPKKDVIKSPILWGGHHTIGEKAIRRYGIEIAYTDALGNWQHTPNGHIYTRLRMLPGTELGEMKYHGLKGVPTMPYFTAFFAVYANAENKKLKQESVKRLYIVEGELKALALCRLGVPAVAIPGIHGFGKSREGFEIARHVKLHEVGKPKPFVACRRKYDLSGNEIASKEEAKRRAKKVPVYPAQSVGYDLAPELVQFIQNLPNLEEIVLLHDADVMDLGKDGTDKRRLGSFFTAVRNFRRATESLPIATYYCYPLPKEGRGKGIDDILSEQPTNEDKEAILRDMGARTILLPIPKRDNLEYQEKHLEQAKEFEATATKALQELASNAVAMIADMGASVYANRIIQCQGDIERYQRMQETACENIARIKALGGIVQQATASMPPSNSNFAVIDLRKTGEAQLYAYFKAGAVKLKKNAVAVGYHGKQLHFPFSGKGAGAYICDWFEVTIVSDVFLKYEPTGEITKSMEGLPSTIELPNGFTLEWSKRNAGSWKYCYYVWHNGQRFGTLVGGDMGVVQNDFCQFKAENERLYIHGFFQEFEEFMTALKGKLNNYTRIDLCFDFNEEAFVGHSCCSHKGALDFFTLHWLSGNIAKIGRKCDYSAHGAVSNGNIKLNGAMVGGGSAPKQAVVYSKSLELLEVHKPYINDYHELNGINGEVFRYELRLKREELEKYNAFDVKALESPTFIAEMMGKSAAGFFEFVCNCKSCQGQKAVRNRPKLPLFTVEKPKSDRLERKCETVATKDTGRTVYISMKKHLRNAMLLGQKDELVLIWRLAERYHLSFGDKLERWYEALQEERAKKNYYYPYFTYGEMFSELVAAKNVAIENKDMPLPIHNEYLRPSYAPEFYDMGVMCPF